MLIIFPILFVYLFFFRKVSTYLIPSKEIEKDSLKKISCMVFIDWKNANPVAPEEEWITYFNSINLKYWKRERGYLGSPENINKMLRKAVIDKIINAPACIKRPLKDYLLEEIEIDERLEALISNKTISHIEQYPLHEALLEESSIELIVNIVLIDWKERNPVGTAAEWEHFFDTFDRKLWLIKNRMIGDP
jgi:hypothetical protein